MEFTGERVVPGQIEPDLFNEHLARYCFAEALVRSKRVLDAGCGLAYGSHRLAREADVVFALDNAYDALTAGREAAPEASVRYLQGDAAAFPLRDDSLDVVVAFEVIEHLEDWQGFLQETQRVLTSGGQLLVSTPNKSYYAESRETPNPYHVHEFDFDEFREALHAVFPHVLIFAENHTNAITFTPSAVQGVRTRFESFRDNPEAAHFFLAVCSDRPLFGSPAFVYVPDAGNILREREHHIAKLKAEIAQKAQWLEETSQELHEISEKRSQDQQEAQESIDRLEAELAERVAWLREVESAAAAERKESSEWVKKIESEAAASAEWAKQTEAIADQHAAWARRLDDEIEETRKWAGDIEQRMEERTAWAKQLETDMLEKAEWAKAQEAEVKRLAAIVRARDELVEERTAWVRNIEAAKNEVISNFERLERERQETLDQLLASNAKLQELEQTIVERTEWARRLDSELSVIYTSRGYAMGRKLRMIPPPPSASDENSGSE